MSLLRFAVIMLFGAVVLFLRTMSSSQYPHYGEDGGRYPFSDPPGLFDLNYLVLPESTLQEVLQRACAERGISGTAERDWVNSMMEKFSAVGVDSARDFIEGSWSVNHDLHVVGCERLPHDTIRMLLRLCCEVIYHRGVKYGNEHALEHMRFERAAAAHAANQKAAAANAANVAK